jgi:hypothetical protein
MTNKTIAVVAVVAILGIVVTSNPIGAQALVFVTRLKDSGELWSTKEISFRQDKATGIIDADGKSPSYFTMDGVGTFDGNFMQEYTRKDGTKYTVPLHIQLAPSGEPHHKWFTSDYSIDLSGEATLDGHSKSIVGQLFMKKYGSIAGYGGATPSLILTVGKDSSGHFTNIPE